MKQRSIPLCVIYSIITCGIYSIYWFICLTDESRIVSDRYQTSGGMAFLFNLITWTTPGPSTASLPALCPSFS